MPKIIGNPTLTPVLPADWNQTDETKVDYIKNKPDVVTFADYATTDKGGVVRTAYSFGTSINSSGQLYLVQASNEAIDKRSNPYYVITPSNLEYAVKSVGDGYYATKTEMEKAIREAISSIPNGDEVSY